MRYTVLTSRPFHNRITRYLGVLVGAALVASTWGCRACRAGAERQKRHLRVTAPAAPVTWDGTDRS